MSVCGNAWTVTKLSKNGQPSRFVLRNTEHQNTDDYFVKYSATSIKVFVKEFVNTKKD